MLDMPRILWLAMGTMPLRNALLPFAALLVASAPPSGTPSGTTSGTTITVAVTNVTVAQGRVHVDICPKARFLKEDCPWSGEAPAVIGTTIVTVADVPPGVYAAQAFHDRNGNHKVDRTLFGIPTEPVGFSNDAPIHMSPPKWADAAIQHGETAQTITLKLRSFL